MKFFRKGLQSEKVWEAPSFFEKKKVVLKIKYKSVWYLGKIQLSYSVKFSNLLIIAIELLGKPNQIDFIYPNDILGILQ